MKKAQKITAALAISMGLTMGATPAANAIIRAPLAQANDQMSRSVVFIDGGDCTGTLIDKDWVLTAQHCLKGPGDSSGVTIGSTLDIGPDMKNFERRTVSEIKTPFPVGGSRGKSADLALLKLNKSSSVLPAKVYDKKFEKPREGTRTRSYGWSTTSVKRDSDGEIITLNARKVPFQTGKLVDVRNVPAEDQMVGSYYAYPLAHAKLDGTARTVPGDSGGPLFLSDGRLYGVLRGSSKDIDKSAKNPWAKFDGSSYSGYTVIQDEIDWINRVTGVDFTDPARNIELQKKSDANPQKFRAPTKSDYRTSEDEETLFLQIVYHSIMSDIDPNYPKPPIPEDLSVINRTPRDPRPYDSNIQAGDDKIPTTTSTSKKRPDWITNPDYPTSKPSTSKKPKPQPEPSTTKNLLPDEPSTTKEKPTTTSKAEPKPSTTKPTTTSKAEPKPSTTKPTTTSKAEPKPSTTKPTTTSKAEPKPSTTKPTTTSKAEPKPSTTKPTTTSKAEPKPKPKPSTTSTTSTSKAEPKPKPKPSTTSTTSKAEPKPSTPKDKPTSTSKEEPKPSTPKDKPTTTSKAEPSKPSTPKDKPTTTSKEEPKPVESSSPSESTEAPSLSETTDASEKPSSSSPSVSSPSPDEPSELTTSADSNSTAPDSDGDGTSTADSTSKNPSTSAKSTTSEDDEPVEETTKPTTSKSDDNDGDDSSNTPSSSSSSQVGDFTDPKGVAIKGTTLNEDQLLKAINAGTKNRPGSNPQKILDSLLAPLPASSQGNAAIAGPVVDTGGSVEKEGFFERIKNFLFG